GGGGAILIASSTSVTFNGATISANGGNGALPSTGGTQSAQGGGSSGGSIRVVANRLSGSVLFRISPGQVAFAGSAVPGGGAPGLVRVEGFDTSSLSASTATANYPISTSLPNPVSAPNSPQLVIASVGGVSAPPGPLGPFSGPPDIVLPANQPNAGTVVVQASGIPAGTAVTVSVIPTNGPPASGQSGSLTGTTASSSTTASVTLSPGVNVLTASAIIDLTVARAGPPLIINGDKVDRIEIAATFGGPAQTTYITHSGKRIAR